MQDTKHNFNQSFKYALHLREADPYFIGHMYALISRIVHKKSVREDYLNNNLRKPNGDYANRHFTCLKPKKFLLNKDTSATKDGKDYRLYNLTRNCSLSTKRTYQYENGKEFSIIQGFSLWFKNKTAAKDCMKELGIKDEHIFLAGWIDDAKMYEVAFIFKNGIFEPQYKRLTDKIKFFLNSNELRYNAAFSSDVTIPSSIYDRWYDIFAQKVLYNPKEIRHKTGNLVSYKQILEKVNFLVSKYRYNRNTYSRVNYFISNKRYVNDIRAKTLYITNHYINKYNPYKTKDARKDWKFAAEEYLNEVLGKFKYRQEVYRNALNEADCYKTKDAEKYVKYLRNNGNFVTDIYLLYDGTKTSIRNIEEWKDKITYYTELLKKDPSERTERERNELCFTKRPQTPDDEYIKSQIQYYENQIKMVSEDIEVYKKIIHDFVVKEIEKAKEEIQNNKDRYLTLFFSKKEAELFIRSLNLKTKISAHKLRKIVLDELCRLGLLNQTKDCECRKFCREFSLVIDKFKNLFINVNKSIINTINFIFNNINSLQDRLENNLSKMVLIHKMTSVILQYHYPPS